MTLRPFKIAVAGAHSTGKSTFLQRLWLPIEDAGLRVAYVHSSAAEARQLGFPILAEHTFESTAWIIAKSMQLEAQATLAADVILVDRPILDALGYLHAALERTGRTLREGERECLEAICGAWAKQYNLFFLTRIDPAMPLAEGRDTDLEFRALAGKAVAAVVKRLLPTAVDLTPEVADAGVTQALASIERWRNAFLD